MHEAICASCGTPTMLPFEPTAERPGYCLSCYSERGGVSADSATKAPRKQPPKNDAPGERSADELPARQRRRPQPERETQRESGETVDSSGVFAGLDVQSRTRSALSRMGIFTPTPIQQQTIPSLLQGRDVVGQAQTGSGKTLAFGIPLVEGSDRSVRGVQGLVLVPTRELAIQVASVIEDVSEKRVSVQLLYGGRGIGGEKSALQKGTQIVVGTPGRTLDHLRQGNLKLDAVRMLVLDEADEMLDRGFAKDVEAIIAATPTTRQTALFSATLPDWVEKTAKKHLRDPKTVEVIADEDDKLKIEHLIYRIDKASKISALRTLLNQRDDAPIIVFGKTKHGVKKLAKQLVEDGYPVSPLQGNMSQNARERVMEDFRSGATPVLVATNVAARGLDVEGIAQVINYDLPDSLQLFTHRVGRTGRMGKSGEAITFVTPEDDKKWREIERGFETNFVIKRWTNDGSGTADKPPGRQEAAAPRPAARPRQAQPKQAQAPRAQQRSGDQSQQRGQAKSGQSGQSRQSEQREQPEPRGNRQQNSPSRQRDAAPRQDQRTNGAPPSDRPRYDDSGPERGNAKPGINEVILPDTPQEEAERRELARTSHTPPPGGGAKRSPWLRFGRRG